MNLDLKYESQRNLETGVFRALAKIRRETSAQTLRMDLVQRYENSEKILKECLPL